MFVLDQDPPRTSSRLGSQRSRERQVLDVYSQLHRDYLNRSIFGYIWVYNLLPKWITHTSNVKAFQSGLQQILRNFAGSNIDNWQLALSARISRSSSLLWKII